MSEAMARAIEELEEKLREPMKVVTELKQAINLLCRHAGMPERYQDANPAAAEAKPSIRSLAVDQFYGRPLATVVGEILEMRKEAKLGPGTVNEVYDDLIKGGFKFDSTNEENSKRGLRSSLAKNPKFHKLPNGSYGLTAWYPAVKAAKPKDSASNGGGDTDDEPGVEGADPEANRDPLDVLDAPVDLANVKAPEGKPEPKKGGGLW